MSEGVHHIKAAGCTNGGIFHYINPVLVALQNLKLQVFALLEMLYVFMSTSKDIEFIFSYSPFFVPVSQYPNCQQLSRHSLGNTHVGMDAVCSTFDAT